MFNIENPSPKNSVEAIFAALLRNWNRLTAKLLIHRME